jgi:hypothetical protein
MVFVCSRAVTRVELIREEDGFSTRGLARFGQAEVAASVDGDDLVAGVQAFLDFVVAYLLAERRPLTSEQTFVYGSSLVKFIAREDGVLEAWDYDWANRIYVSGAN